MAAEPEWRESRATIAVIPSERHHNSVVLSLELWGAARSSFNSLTSCIRKRIMSRGGVFTRAWRLAGNATRTTHFCGGSDSLCVGSASLPRLEDVNRFLRPLTGFQAKAVSGYIPAFLFFDCLRNRAFPTTITIRRSDEAGLSARAGYLPRHCGSRSDAYRPGIRGYAGALRRVRPHGGGTGGGDPR